jgi:hypothetical protein
MVFARGGRLVRAIRDGHVRLRNALTRVLLAVLVNLGLLVALLIPVELIFGTWIRPMQLGDLKRFSIPIGTSFQFDTSSLYESGARNPVRYSRDQWGLRGTHRSLGDIDLLTVGGSTTDQRYLDDAATWQAVAQEQLRRKGRALVIANAGVDGQSTIGIGFNFRFWFPLLADLRPKTVLFYVGINDVVRDRDRGYFDGRVDATHWRVRSATVQLFLTVRSNIRARHVRVWHGRKRPDPSAFTEQGLLDPQERLEIARQSAGSFRLNIEGLRQSALASGARPIFMTQTALGWNGDRSPPRGLKETVESHGRMLNYADVAFVHQSLNRTLLDFCGETRTTCFDLGNDVKFDADDYYDYLHNTPRGAEKIGRYLADRLAELDIAPRASAAGSAPRRRGMLSP